VTANGPAPGAGIALKLASVLLFTIMAAMIKAAREVVPVGEAVFFRSFFALPPILIWAAARGTLADAFRVASPSAHLSRGVVGVGAMAAGFAALGLLPLPEAIAIGYAAPLLSTLARVCVQNNYSRLSWAVLDWNADAIALYALSSAPHASYSLRLPQSRYWRQAGCIFAASFLARIRRQAIGSRRDRQPKKRREHRPWALEGVR